MTFIGLSYHRFPGFYNWKIVDKLVLSATATPYTMCLNVEKSVYAFFFVYFGQKLATTKKAWLPILRWSAVGFLIAFVLLLLANFFLNMVALAPKLPQITPVWLPRMLLFVCLAE